MKIVTTRQLTKRLENEDVSPSYLLLGDDTFILDFNVNMIKTAFLKEGGSTIRFSIGDDSENNLMDELNSISLFENRRLIQVRQISRLSSKIKSEFIEYLSKPAPDICLILLADNYYDRSKFIETLKNTVVNLDARSPINENSFKEWMLDICQTKNINIDGAALELIIEKQGNSLAQVFSEITNLWLMIEEKGLITKELVEQVVGYEREYPLWKYLHSLGKKNLSSSLEMIDSLIDFGVSIPQITSALNTLFENVYWTKSKKSYNMGYPSLNRYLQNNLHTYSSMFNVEEISQIFVSIRNADVMSKTRSISPHNILIPLTINICQGINA